MRTKTITYTQDVYTYDELDEYAQMNYRNALRDEAWHSELLEDSFKVLASRILSKYGFSEPTELYWEQNLRLSPPSFTSSATVGELHIVVQMFRQAGFVGTEIEIFDLDGSDFGIDDDDSDEGNHMFHVASDYAQELVQAIRLEMQGEFILTDEYQGSDENAREHANVLALEFDIYGSVV